MDNKNSIRLNKFISESGICSRREADRFIEKGVVFINGRKAKIADPVFPGDQVMVNGLQLEPLKAESKIYIAFNKPVGVTCTTEESTRGNIVDYVNHPSRVFPIGRLDKDSQGLIFLTNDGNIVNKILRAENAHEKEYVVTVDKPITTAFISDMSNGVPILDVVTKKCRVQMEGPYVFRIILVQGLNRQIRRMCAYFGYKVMKLERTRIMNVNLKGIPSGDWRDLTSTELEGIFQLIKYSSSENVGSKPADMANSKNQQSVTIQKSHNKKPFKKSNSPQQKSHKARFEGNKSRKANNNKRRRG